jgi:hypothetical protein
MVIELESIDLLNAPHSMHRTAIINGPSLSLSP